MRTLRYALRQLAATPGFTAIAVLIVAIGIGSSTAMFSVVDAVVLKPLALPESDRLVQVYETNLERDLPMFEVSVLNYVDFRARSKSFASLAAVGWQAMNLTGSGEPELIQVRRVTANFFGTMGVSMARGRDFRPEEDRAGGPKVVVLSDGFWRRRFAARPDVVGQVVRLDGDAYEIVGVLPEGLTVPGDDDDPTPAAFNLAEERRLDHGLDVYGRLAPGVSLQAADQELHAISAEMARTLLPASEHGWRTRIVPLIDGIVGDSLRRTLGVLFGAVALLLLVACANLSNLLLVRASTRTFELAVRNALGESRGQAIRQLLVESLAVTALGGAFGIALAAWSVDAIRTLPIARVAEIGIDARVLAVAIAAMLVSGLLAGLGPALRASRVAPQEVLKAHAARLAPRSRLRDGMVVAQLALSLTLLVGATLVARSFWSLLRVDPGFSSEGTVTLAVRPAADAEAFYDAVEARVRALPGVEAAGLITTLPLGPGSTTSQNVFAVGASRLAAGQSIQASWRLIGGDYFGAMRIPVLRGRTFEGLAPQEARRSVIISASLARTLWGDEDPIGREISPVSNRPLRIIGVVGDIRNTRLATPPMPAFYWSYHRFVYGPMRLVVRSGQAPAAIIPALRQAIRSVDPAAPIFQVRTMAEIRAESLSEERLLLTMLWAFAGVALLLAALGTYGVVAFAVQQRTREFGIRLAIGAEGHDVRRLVLGQAARLTVAGAGLGLAGAIAASRLIATLLFGVTAFDLASYGAATGILAAAVLVAAWWPAWRAGRVSPLVALTGKA
jgi:predicted permease